MSGICQFEEPGPCQSTLAAVVRPSRLDVIYPTVPLYGVCSLERWEHSRRPCGLQNTEQKGNASVACCMFRSSDLIESRMRHKYGCFFLLIILNSHILNLLVTCLTSHVLYLIKKQQSDKFFSPTSFFLFSHLSLFKEYNLQKK